MPPNVSTLTVDRLPAADIVAMAQCIAIDVDSFPYPSSTFVLRAASAPVWIAREGGDPRVLGFIAASQRRPGELYVDGVATAAGARHRGVGRALVRAAMAYAREAGLGEITLHVWPGNTVAVALYRSEGFAVRLRVPRFYARGLFGSTEAYRMVRVVDRA
jgi:ribosomal protein S18 acetylase RimI-like enzyme